MGLRKYTVAEFRKNIREAFNAIDNENSVYITRHGVRYEVRLAPVQPGKKQIADHNEGIVAQMARKAATAESRRKDREVIASFPENGDAMAIINPEDVYVEPPTPKKNIAEADASEVQALKTAIAAKEAELEKIDINTQDFDEIERGSQLAADLDTLRRQLAGRG